jgi:NADP-dependent aldehyde dehydrogenase
VDQSGFTGSRAGGQSLMKVAANRSEPIPFYAEMSSLNPIFILPKALNERMEQIAVGLHGSVTLGVGQFCTNPGLVFIPEQGSAELIKRLQELVAATASCAMLTQGISSAYRDGVRALQTNSGVETIVYAIDEVAKAALFVTDAQSFVEDSSLNSEVFGPATLLIKYSSDVDLMKAAHSLEGQLTATIHANEAELKSCHELIAILEAKAGRLVLNGFPTGVEVGHAMVHDGPYPATSDGRSTSVGTRAALRFVRPVCYQDFADAALPDELKNGNPLSIWRMLDGKVTKDRL